MLCRSTAAGGVAFRQLSSVFQMSNFLSSEHVHRFALLLPPCCARSPELLCAVSPSVVAGLPTVPHPPDRRSPLCTLDIPITHTLPSPPSSSPPGNSSDRKSFTVDPRPGRTRSAAEMLCPNS
jgi:hypothetical protein